MSLAYTLTDNHSPDCCQVAAHKPKAGKLQVPLGKVPALHFPCVKPGMCSKEVAAAVLAAVRNQLGRTVLPAATQVRAAQATCSATHTCLAPCDRCLSSAGRTSSSTASLWIPGTTSPSANTAVGRQQQDSCQSGPVRVLPEGATLYMRQPVACPGQTPLNS
jgi:hypothetical protein